MGGQCQYAHLGLWLPYFNFVKYPKFGNMTLAAIQNAKVIQSSIQSSNALKATYTSISAQGRTPKDARSSVGFFQLLELFLLFAKIPCLTSEQMKRTVVMMVMAANIYWVHCPKCFIHNNLFNPIALWSRYYYYTHFKQQGSLLETKEQSGEVVCPKSQRR